VALWEVRAPLLLGAVLLLALNLLRTRRHIDVLGWLIIIGSGLKGIQGTWRYVVTLNRTITYNNLLEHEEALFFPAFYLFLLLLFIFGGNRWQKRAGVCFLPFVLLADFANQRRASTAALVLALVALAVIVFVVLRERRRHIVGVMLLAAVMLAGYAGVYWNSGSRLAQPIRAIKSQFMPNSRDESSNLYRELENRGLMWQIKSSPVLGQGYGHEMPLVAGMWDGRDVSPFMLYMPHNSILWVWWRTGIAGFTCFWLTIGVAIARNCQLARATNDPYLRRWAIFAVLVTTMWMLLGFLDQGVLLSREVVYVAVVLTVPEVLWRLNTAKLVQGAEHGCA
jgi:O-antigen ligase